MGTYTTNYQLYMPTIGEQGWGELVNGNFATIDATMKSLSDNIGMLDTKIDAVEERVTVLEAGNFETLNVAGTITANNVNATEGYFDNISSMNLVTLNDGYLANIQITNSQTFFNVQSQTNYTFSKNYTYKANPICNTVTFTVWARGTNGNNAYGQSKISVNDVVVVDTGVVYSSLLTKQETITLKDNDIVTIYGVGKRTGSEGDANLGASMSSGGYLVSNI